MPLFAMGKTVVVRLKGVRFFSDFIGRLEKHCPIASERDWNCQTLRTSMRIHIGIVTQVSELVPKSKPNIGHCDFDTLVCYIKGLTCEGVEIDTYRFIFTGDAALKLYNIELLKGNFIGVLNPSKLGTENHLPQSYYVALNNSLIWFCSLSSLEKSSSTVTLGMSNRNKYFDDTQTSRKLLVNQCTPSTLKDSDYQNREREHQISIGSQCHNLCSSKCCPHHSNICPNNSVCHLHQSLNLCSYCSNTCHNICNNRFVSNGCGHCNHNFSTCRNNNRSCLPDLAYDGCRLSQQRTCLHNNIDCHCHHNHTVNCRLDHNNFEQPKERSSPFEHPSSPSNHRLKRKRRYHLYRQNDYRTLKEPKNSKTFLNNSQESSTDTVSVTSLLEHIAEKQRKQRSISNVSFTPLNMSDQLKYNKKKKLSNISGHRGVENQINYSDYTAGECILIDSDECSPIEEDIVNNTAELVRRQTPSKESCKGGIVDHTKSVGPSVATNLLVPNKNNFRKVRKLFSCNKKSDIFIDVENQCDKSVVLTNDLCNVELNQDTPCALEVASPPHNSSVNEKPETVLSHQTMKGGDNFANENNTVSSISCFIMSKEPNVLTKKVATKSHAVTNLLEQEFQIQPVIETISCGNLEEQAKTMTADSNSGNEDIASCHLMENVAFGELSKTDLSLAYKTQLNPSSESVEQSEHDATNYEEEVSQVFSYKPGCGYLMLNINQKTLSCDNGKLKTGSVCDVSSPKQILQISPIPEKNQDTAINNGTDSNSVSKTETLMNSNLLDDRHLKITKKLQQETFQQTKIVATDLYPEVLAPPEARTILDKDFALLDTSFLKMKGKANFILDISLVGVKPNFVGDKPFDLVSGNCTKCLRVIPFSQLIKSDESSFKYFCPVCYKKGKMFETQLLYFFSLLAADDSGKCVEIIATEKEAEAITGLSLSEYLSNNSVASKCWDKILSLTHKNNCGVQRKCHLSVSTLCTHIGSSIVPVLSSNITTEGLPENGNS